MADDGRKKGGRRHGATQVGALVGAILDPVLEKRAGVSASLIHNWGEIVRAQLAAVTRPEKVQWPRRASDDDPYEPATLTIAADPSAAFILQHETGEVIGRVNAFLGFAAIGRIRIEQKPVGDSRKRRAEPAPLPESARQRLKDSVSDIENDDLRAALERLGESVLRQKTRP